MTSPRCFPAIAFFAIAFLCAGVRAQSANESDSATLEISPALPPVPSLKYQLLFSDVIDQFPGDGAPIYYNAILLMRPNADDESRQAMQAFNSGDMSRFDSLASELDRESIRKCLEVAGRREHCNWQTPLREMGASALMPQLGPLRNLVRLLQVHALWLLRQGKMDDALATVRIGYALAENIGRDPVIISQLMSLVAQRMMNDCIRKIIERPGSPNLYWALINLPSQRQPMQRDMMGERAWWNTSNLTLQQLYAGDLSSDQWLGVVNFMRYAITGSGRPGGAGGVTAQEIVRQTNPQLASRARDEYAAAHNLTVEQVAAVDPAIVICSFYFQQYRIAQDNMDKLRGLPYPQLLPKAHQFDADIVELTREQPANYFLVAIPKLSLFVTHCAETDREIAALANVEAIRAYAAANSGRLPAQLDDMKDLPAMDNPMTGLPFDYAVEGDSATIADSQSTALLAYTVKLRK